MKITFVATVLNEEKNINEFIKSILFQSKKVDEIIIVDGGSTDRTVEIIKKYNTKIKIIIKKGDRSIGRNEAIRISKNEIILCSDSGCILDKDWVKNIAKPFKDKKVDVVAGYYRGNAKSLFQKCLVPYALTMEDKIDPENFLPATRSMAFRKSIWNKAGGFPEEFSNNEDYVFAKRLREIESNIVFNRKAIVNWIPRKNLKEAFVMFFRFALGDAESGIIRPKVFLIFLRYIIGFYLLALFLIMKSFIPLYAVILGVSTYIVWSIFKNYKYVKNIKALFLLPILQLTSDIAVLLGTTFGIIKGTRIRNIIAIVKNNKSVVFLIGLYIACMILFIDWGIPGNNHPFNYFMDEWHQAQSVRNVFSQGTSNIAGSANGSMFHFFLSGVFLVPSILLGIFNPFSIKSSVDSLEMQQNLFEILRLNTLFFGVLSMILIAYIAKKYFKFNPFWTVFLFLVNPIFLTLSNYFKYDIALIFWIILSFLFLLKYSLKPNSTNFYLSAFFSGIALSVKLGAIPLLFILASAFLLFNKNRIKHLGELAGGILIFFCTFLLLGIPDLLLGKGNITEYLYDNLIRAPSYTQNYILGMPYWAYLIIKGVPSAFGTMLSLVSFFGLILVIINIFKKRLSDFHRNPFILVLIFLVFFIVSLVLLQIEARGNRLLVLLPFMVLLGSFFIEKILKTYSNILKKILIVIFVLFLLFQTVESISWLYIKFQVDPRQKSSEWIISNIPSKSVIGIENIPIYQFLPDIILKEFYLKEHGLNKSTNFNYVIVGNVQDKDLPAYLVISNEEIDTNYIKHSSKKSLVNKLRAGGYEKIFVASPDFSLLRLFRDNRDYFMSGLIQAPVSVSIYKKP